MSAEYAANDLSTASTKGSPMGPGASVVASGVGAGAAEEVSEAEAALVDGLGDCALSAPPPHAASAMSAGAMITAGRGMCSG